MGGNTGHDFSLCNFHDAFKKEWMYSTELMPAIQEAMSTLSLMRMPCTMLAPYSNTILSTETPYHKIIQQNS